MTKPLDLDAPLTTRDGREVRIYARDGSGSYPIHGAIKCGEDWVMFSWTKNGQACLGGISHGKDLINTPVKREG